MIFILLFILVISACDTTPIRIAESSDCIDTGENIECASYSQKDLKKSMDKEMLGFSDDTK